MLFFIVSCHSLTLLWNDMRCVAFEHKNELKFWTSAQHLLRVLWEKFFFSSIPLLCFHDMTKVGVCFDFQRCFCVTLSSSPHFSCKKFPSFDENKLNFNLFWHVLGPQLPATSWKINQRTLRNSCHYPFKLSMGLSVMFLSSSSLCMKAFHGKTREIMVSYQTSQHQH